jgi:hypothetical protein
MVTIPHKVKPKSLKFEVPKDNMKRADLRCAIEHINKKTI